MNYKCVCEFDGRGFLGWQSQPNKQTVQDNIENALLKIIDLKKHIIGVGRTDSNVSAKNYVFNFHTNKNIKNMNKFLYSLNSICDKRIYIKSIRKINNTFNARYDCKKKEYRYYLYKGISPINRPFHYEVNKNIKAHDILKVLLSLKGKYDFSAFCRKKSLMKDNTVNIFDIKVMERGRELTICFIGNRFLHNMIRLIMGSCLDIINGKIDMSIKDILKTKDIKYAGKMVPAEALIFHKAYY